MFSRKNDKLEVKENPNLQIGDAFVLDKLLQQDLSEQCIEIKDISTYDFVEKKGASFLGLAGTLSLRFKIKRRDAQDFLVISKQINKEQIAQVFSTDNLADIMLGRKGAKLKRLNNSKFEENLESWTAMEYNLVANMQQGYYYEEDYREKQISIHDQGLNSLDHYCLQNESRTKGVDIEIYNQEQTKIYLTLYLPLNGLVKEFLPKSTS